MNEKSLSEMTSDEIKEAVKEKYSQVAKKILVALLIFQLEKLLP
jgi:hypothetical protein